MKYLTNMQEIENKENNLDNEINLIFLFQTILREKLNLAVIVIISTVFSIFYSLYITPVWKGTFNIVISKENKSYLPANTNIITRSLFNAQLGETSNETEKIILMSPSVLNPVYEFVRNSYEKKGIPLEDIYFEKWRKDYLEIKFKEKTNVLSVSYFDPDKKLILETLKMISKEYQDFSGRERRESITDSIVYLKSLKEIWQEKSLKSLKKLNEFSIKHGLGNIDGFVGIGNPKKSILNINKSLDILGNNDFGNITNSLLDQNSLSGAGQRYDSQFALLSQYETAYTDLSSKLKPSSKYLISLQTKINNLRESLKRPNEILIEYKNLLKTSERDESIFDDITSKLIAVELESIKNQNPWEMISVPTINKNKVSPNKRQLVFTTFLISTILGSLILIIKEKITGKIFNLESVESKLNFNYLNTLYKSQNQISEKILYKIIHKISQENKVSSISFIKVGFISENKIPKIINDKNIKINIYDFTDLENINKSKQSLIFIEKGITTFQEIKMLNKFLEVYDSQIYGWIFIE